MASSVLSFTPTSADIERYKRARALSRDLNHKIIKNLPRDSILQMGRQLGVVHKNTLVLGAEDELSVLMDCCLYDFIQDGKNAIERYAERHDVSTEERELLQASLQACYRLVVPLSRIEGAGVHFIDVLTREELFVMDLGMSQNSLKIGYGTRTIPLGPFWMTGGAGLPASGDAAREAIARLNEEGLLRNGSFTDPHRAAPTIVRTLLEKGASEHVRYEDVPESEFEGARQPMAHRQSRPANIVSRNSQCLCGSGKRYKRCCGRR